jgi:hypothetical protein
MPVVAAAAVPDAAVQQAASIVGAMLEPVPRARELMVRQGMRFLVIGARQQTTDMPEYAHEPATLNQRARGIYDGNSTASAAEENVLCYEHDGWRGENITVHEFAHALKIAGLDRTEPGFHDRVQAAFEAAHAKGIYAGLYADTNAEEYWAEGVQAYFDVHQNHDPHDVNTRTALRTADPGLFALIDGVFHDAKMPTMCPGPSFAESAWYRIGNAAGGHERALDDLSVVAPGRFSGQLWKLRPAGRGLWRLTNAHVGDAKALDTRNDGINDPEIVDTGNYTGQLWTISYVDADHYRLRNVFLADGRSLEATTDGSPRVVMGSTADSGAQAWTIRREP